MTRAEALEVLGLGAGASPHEIGARYRDLSRSAHPDAGGDAAAFSRLAEARTVATDAAWDEPCMTCLGAGDVSRFSGFSGIKLTCVDCGGTGRRFGVKVKGG